VKSLIIIPPLPEGGGGILFYLCPSVLPSVQDIFRRIFLSNCWWQKSDIWSQASYRYTILWVGFLDPSDSYFLFADLVGFYAHWTYMHIFRNIRFLSSIVAEKNATKNVHICSMCIKINKVGKQEVGIYSYFLFADLVGFYTHWTYMHIFRRIFLSSYWWQESDIWSQAS
jgi:hypothetical protein